MSIEDWASHQESVGGGSEGRKERGVLQAVGRPVWLKHRKHGQVHVKEKREVNFCLEEVHERCRVHEDAQDKGRSKI